MIYLTIGFFGVLVWHVISEVLWRKERRELTDRLMAKTYQEFKYYNEQYQDDVKTLQKLRETEFKKFKKEESKNINEDTEKFLSELEEDWRPETIDEDVIKKMGIGNESEDNREASNER